MGARRSAILGATRGCLASGRSIVLRAYAVIGLVLILLSSLLVILALPTWIAIAEGTSATLMLGQGLLLLGGLLVVVAFFLPIYLAHRHLPPPGDDPWGERLYGGFGFAIVLAVYLGLIISAPPDARGNPPSAIAWAIEPLYGINPVIGVLPPVATIIALVVVDRLR